MTDTTLEEISPNKNNQGREDDPEPEPEQAQEKNPIPDFYKKVVETLPDMDRNMQMYIVAQAMHETGIFKSPLYLEKNNAFGMTFPNIRETTAAAQDENGFAVYDSVEDSIKDLQLYYDHFNYPGTFDSVADYVKYAREKGYFTAPLKTYTNAVNKYIQQVKRFAQ